MKLIDNLVEGIVVLGTLLMSLILLMIICAPFIVMLAFAYWLVKHA